MKVNGKEYKSIWSDDNRKIFIIDQTLLPFSFNVKHLNSFKDVLNAISMMQVRGAPLIGVTAAFGIYIAMQKNSSDSSLKDAGNKLISTRPTAINLRWAVEKIIDKLSTVENTKRVDMSFQLAENLAQLDQKNNQKIGEFGKDLIRNIHNEKGGVVNILTHCNAGWLATVDWGTATAPIYKSRDSKIPIHVWVDETRPRNQGSMLTAWELENEEIDHTIIADNTGGHLMQNNLVDIVITGSDRTTFKGDVCNKIGTYLKALAAKENKIPFYVALPSSTIDWEISDSKKIIIEQRGEEEVHYISGIDQNSNLTKIRVTPENSKAVNYAFDTTPAKYISGLITENGICSANEIDIKNKNAK